MTFHALPLEAGATKVVVAHHSYIRKPRKKKKKKKTTKKKIDKLVFPNYKITGDIIHG